MKREMNKELLLLQQALQSCIENWKLDHDVAGYEAFIRTLQLLERVIELYFDELENLEIIAIWINQLDSLIQNMDFIGVLDLLEYDLQPLVRKWIKESEVHDRKTEQPS
ncbi:hypothetical protein [Caldalkalibacillus mannanilyticus]|uniref:hypothetical protein n=1 Tax=Caldalkalibacillus mannanilyticus TaxID=1418 RepID=UPI00046AEF66|nr:hypothetical protein [Caldalkalibacillus mannanilyticus]